MMADFLTRLAAQALGMRPAIRPDIAPVFGPAAGVDANSRPPMESEAVVATKASPPAPHDDFVHQSTQEQLPAMQREGSGRQEKAGRVPPAPLPAPAASNPHALKPLADRATDREIESERTSLIAQSLPAEVPQRQHGKQNLPPQQSTQAAVQVAISPQTRAALHAPVPSHETAARMGGDVPAPAVHVTIGRVEVRAIMTPPAPVQRIPEKRVAQTQSLGEYLQERNRGRR